MSNAQNSHLSNYTVIKQVGRFHKLCKSGKNFMFLMIDLPVSHKKYADLLVNQNLRPTLNPNQIMPYEVTEQADGQISVKEEYCNAGTLSMYLNVFDNQYALELFTKGVVKQVTQAVMFSNRVADISHGNINPETVFISTDGNVKLSMSNTLSMRNIRDSPYHYMLNSYCAPERRVHILSRITNCGAGASSLIKAHDHIYNYCTWGLKYYKIMTSEASDMWSIGALIVSLMMRKNFLPSWPDYDGYQHTLPNNIEDEQLIISDIALSSKQYNPNKQIPGININATQRDYKNNQWRKVNHLYRSNMTELTEYIQLSKQFDNLVFETTDDNIWKAIIPNDQLRHITRRCLELNPADRATSYEIMEYMREHGKISLNKHKNQRKLERSPRKLQDVNDPWINIDDISGFDTYQAECEQIRLCYNDQYYQDYMDWQREEQQTRDEVTYLSMEYLIGTIFDKINLQ